jgi:hypothetical protein
VSPPRKHSSNGLFFPLPQLRESRNPANVNWSEVPSEYLIFAEIFCSFEKAENSVAARPGSRTPRMALSTFGAPTIWAAIFSASPSTLKESSVIGARGVRVLPWTVNVPALTAATRSLPFTISSTYYVPLDLRIFMTHVITEHRVTTHYRPFGHRSPLEIDVHQALQPDGSLSGRKRRSESTHQPQQPKPLSHDSSRKTATVSIIVFVRGAAASADSVKMADL